MEDNSKHLKAFRTHRGQYQRNVLPFGLRNVAATYQRAMSKVVQTISDFACAYIDDLAIFSDTWEEHLNNLEDVFKRLQHFNFSVNLGKCEFSRQKVKYLGHAIGSGVEDSTMWNYRVTGPRHRKTVLHAYGCFSDCGRMLFRSIGWRRQHSSHSFWEQETEPKPTNWSTIERVAYAIIWALNRFETLLWGAMIFFLTDHNPLVFLTSAAPQCPRLQRWALAMTLKQAT
ncbi:retrovirus-related Pol polyprotein from transposon 297 [Trichonephila clavipes]|nr:retrovirus-related Pol polyprotein from transposon 297 [Trichonephila clavipes]